MEPLRKQSTLSQLLLEEAVEACRAGSGSPCCCEEDASPSEGAEPVEEEGRRRIVACFFLLGAASDVTFNAIVLSVAYLVQELGTDVLILIGRAQFVGSGCTMLVLFAMALRRPLIAVHSLPKQCTSLMKAMAYMLVLNTAMVFLAVSGQPLSAAPLQAALLANGVATGLSQSLVGVLSGFMTKFANQPTAASAQVSGVGFGVALPTAVQLLLLPLGLPVRVAAVISYGLAFVVTVCGMVALVHFQATKAFIRCERKSLDEVTGSPGSSSIFEERFSWWAARRFLQVSLPSLGLLINFAAMVYCNLLSPHMPNHGAFPPSELLPTLLIGATNAFDFAGRIFALHTLHQSSAVVEMEGCKREASGSLAEGFLQRLPAISLCLLARLLAGAACISYCLRGPVERALGSNAVVLGFYALGALCGGATTVALTQYAQSLCMRTSGPNMDQPASLPCPLAGQIMLLSCILGSVIGSLIPFPG